MKRNYLVIYGALLIFLLSASGTWAHMFWLSVNQEHPKAGEPVQVDIGFGHKFPQGEGIKAERLGPVRVWAGDGREVALKKIATGRYELVPPAAGVYLLSAQVVPGFVTRTREGMKLGNKKGVPDANHCFHFDMAAKTLVSAGKGKQGFARKTKTVLEIVPLVNPGSLKTGASLPLKVLFQGKPLPKATVKITYDGWSDPKNFFAVTGKTDAQGEFRAKLDKPGRWLIVASHKTPYPNQEECDENLYSASLTFTVR